LSQEAEKPHIHFLIELNPIDAYFIKKRIWARSEYYLPLT